MTELISNGGFRTALTDWVVSNVDHQEEDGHETIGCAELDSVTGAASLYQDITSSTITGATEYLVAFLFSFKKTGGAPGIDLVATLGTQAGEIYATITIEHELIPYVEDEWHRYAAYVLVPITETMRVTFTAANDADVNLWRISDVSVDQAHPTYDFTTRRDIAKRLMTLRHDTSCVKHYRNRYTEVVSQAQREVPKSMFFLDIDTSISTVADRKRYSMAGITAILEAYQVRRVWLEDSENDELYHEVGLWYIESDYGPDVAEWQLTLVLERDPVEAGLTIRLEYLRIPEETSGTANICLDQDWMVAKCMTQLLLEADSVREDPNWLATQLQLWDAKRQALELKYRQRRRPEMMRSTDWRPYL